MVGIVYCGDMSMSAALKGLATAVTFGDSCGKSVDDVVWTSCEVGPKLEAKWSANGGPGSASCIELVEGMTTFCGLAAIASSARFVLCLLGLGLYAADEFGYELSVVG